jgi:flagellin
MSFSINTNVASLQAQNYLRINSNFQSQTINEVTSGLRIVNSGDDAAGLAVANGYRSNEAVLTQGVQNANNGLATLQTIDGGMSNISQLLDRARTLATESASGTFTGDRSQLQSEFSSVLTEINRQATNIGMNQGGEFATSLSVFIGGGMDGTTHSTTDAAALTNGSVSVNLSGSAVDTQSLGLTSYTTPPNDSAALGTITGGLTGGVMDLKFYGPGDDTNSYAGGLTVAVQNLGTATSLSDVVSDINTAITQTGNQAGAANAAFAQQGITAQLDAAGTGIEFTSANGAFAVSGVAATGAVASKNILGNTAAADPVYSAGLQNVQLGWQADMVAGDAQTLSVSAANSQGTITTANVALAGVTTQAAAVTAINAALSTAGGPLAGVVAVSSAADPSNIELLGTGSNAAFQVTVGVDANTAGDGVGGGGSAQGTTVASAGTGGSSLDISTAAGAQTAVSALANAVTTLGTAQAAVGKGENNFNYAINLAQSQLTNEAAAESGIRDANLATEAANLTKAQILMQAGVAALAQANSAPQTILSLLKS